METLIIEPTIKTPQITFDPNRNLFEISGRSLPDNVISTYQPVLDWFSNNLENIEGKHLVFQFKMSYLNSASTKMYSTFLSILEKYYKQGANIEVVWYYPKDDDMMPEEDVLISIKKLPVKTVAVDSMN